MKQRSSSSMTTQYIVLFGVFLLLANIALGVILLKQSSGMIQSLIRKSMLSISNTAADLMDGDAMGAFTEKDVKSEDYRFLLRSLSSFQNNADIEYIYAVRQTGEDAFIFIMDADPADPASYGEDVLVTDALRSAAQGVSAVDDSPAQDRWGNFYSAYSPVFDRYGRVAAIIGVDFNAAWYNEQVWKNTSFIVIITGAFVLMGGTVFLLINRRVRQRFEELSSELTTLSSDVEELTDELLANTGYGGAKETLYPTGDPMAEGGDEIRNLNRKIHAMHEELERYLSYMHAQVNTDALTRVGNTTAYLERQKELEARILDGSAEFSVVVFDINDLKKVNDRFGHASGDRHIRAAAAVIAAGFAVKNTYRIGGDEFIAISEEPADKLEARFRAVDQAVSAYNKATADSDARLSLSRGSAAFVRGQDHAFRDVFVRADKEMYENKAEFHRLAGDAPRS